MPVFNIHHVTKYEYDRPVKESVNEIRIYPFACQEQEVLFHEVNVTDHPDLLLVSDYWGNKAGMFNLMSAHRSMVIESKLIVRTLGRTEPPKNNNGFEQLKNETGDNLSLLELSFMQEIAIVDKIKGLAREVCGECNTVIDTVERCSHYIFENFRYIKGITNIETTVSEILDLRSGVCQDFAHVMLEILRCLHIPCRYVSGYICPNKNGMRGEGATHAWVEAWIPGTGWIGIDPTNNVWVTNHHVKLAVGRHFNDCSPIKGTFKGPARQSLSVFVSVGYEDGHRFEDITNVRLETQESTDDLPKILESFAGQQQQ